MNFIAIFGVSMILAAVVIASGETIRLDSSQGILIPAPIAHTLRVARNAYGGGSASYVPPAVAAPSYAAPAPGPISQAPFLSSPCAKNYLFSCQPNLSPAPCSPSGGGGYGYPQAVYASASSSSSYSDPVAAYSNPVPQYAVPNVKELY